MTHRGTYDRGYLPHRDYHNSLQAITFRLADSMPKAVIAKWRQELSELLSSPDSDIAKKARNELIRRMAKFEDAGHGSCLLRKPNHALVIQDCLLAGHPAHYRLIEWCIMPNHVHVMIRLTHSDPLAEIVRRWKGVSSHGINRLQNRSGPLWERDYFDRFIRDEEHFLRARRYIRRNPVKAGLCATPEDWPFSSAGISWDPDAV